MEAKVTRKDFLWGKFENLKNKIDLNIKEKIENDPFILLVGRPILSYPLEDQNGRQCLQFNDWLMTEIRILKFMREIHNVHELIFCINEAFIPFYKNNALQWDEMKKNNQNRGLLLGLTSENEDFPMSESFEKLLKVYAECFCEVYLTESK